MFHLFPERASGLQRKQALSLFFELELRFVDSLVTIRADDEHTGPADRVRISMYASNKGALIITWSEYLIAESEIAVDDITLFNARMIVNRAFGSGAKPHKITDRASRLVREQMLFEYARRNFLPLTFGSSNRNKIGAFLSQRHRPRLCDAGYAFNQPPLHIRIRLLGFGRHSEGSY